MLGTLFVYGTLCPDCRGALGTAERRRLTVESRTVGTATIAGAMLDLGAYPGVIDGPGTIHGLILELADPAATLSWLDAYEMATGAAESEYDRLVCQAHVVDGTVCEAWVYRLRVAPPGATVIVSGRWTGRY